MNMIIKLQNCQQLQVKRERLWVDKEKLKSVQRIHWTETFLFSVSFSWH